MKKLRHTLLFLFIIFVFSLEGFSFNNLTDQIRIESKGVVIEGIDTQMCISIIDNNQEIVNTNLIIEAHIDNKKTNLYIKNGLAEFSYKFNKKSEILILQDNEIIYSKEIQAIPIWMSILPGLIVILFALILREILLSLFLGLYCGSIIILLHSGHSLLSSLYKSFFYIFEVYILKSISNPNHIYIILFTLMIGGTLFIITKNGGIIGIINHLRKYAKDSFSAQAICFLLGMLLYCDNYINILISGSSMRSITDKYKVSREKLAYIVDTTSSSLASLAFVTTLIGAELVFIYHSIDELCLSTNSYIIFLSSLKYCYYPILSLVFILLIIILKRDYSLMYICEERAREKGITAPGLDNKIQEEIIKVNTNIITPIPRAYNALIPLSLIILASLFSMIYTGWDIKIWDNKSLGILNRLAQIFKNSDFFLALFYSSLIGLISSILLTFINTRLKLKEINENMLKGFKTVLSTVVVLVLSFAVASQASELKASQFISQIIITNGLSPNYLPILSFIISGIISFSLASSVGSMAIIYPLILPTSWFICQEYSIDYEQSMIIFTQVCSSVITGSIFGNHCSPISDTSILSSTATSCNNIQHLKSQLAYALSVATIVILIGFLPISQGYNIWLSYLLMITCCFFVILLIGKKHKGSSYEKSQTH